MDKIELDNLLKVKTPEQVINKYIYGEIYLNNFQIDKLLRLIGGEDKSEERRKNNQVFKRIKH